MERVIFINVYFIKEVNVGFIYIYIYEFNKLMWSVGESNGKLWKYCKYKSVD